MTLTLTFGHVPLICFGVFIYTALVAWGAGRVKPEEPFWPGCLCVLPLVTSLILGLINSLIYLLNHLTWTP